MLHYRLRPCRLSGGDEVLAAFALEVVEGPHTGLRIEVSEPIIIGRDPQADLSLAEDRQISRKHARVRSVEDAILVEDLNSTNGTFVDGEEAHGPTRLRSGGHLGVGVTVLELKTADDASPTVVRTPRDLTRLPEPLLASEAPPALAAGPAEPDYVPPGVVPEAQEGNKTVYSLLDVHTKSKAKFAPIAIFVLVAFAIILYFGIGGGR